MLTRIPLIRPEHDPRNARVPFVGGFEVGVVFGGDEVCCLLVGEGAWSAAKRNAQDGEKGMNDS